MRKLWVKLLIVLAPALLLTVARPAYAGADLYVNGDCGDDAWSGMNPDCVKDDGPKATIQAAIDAAIGGDVISVAPGTYRQLIDFLGKSIKLRSSDGPEVTIINGDIDDDGTGDGTVVSCINNETANTVLDGFMITGGAAASGGGMLNDPGSPTVTNCIFRLNDSGVDGGGGGMANIGSNPTVTNCSFELNTAVFVGGGMFNSGSSPEVTGCTFSNNSALGGGGMHGNGGSRPTVTNCTFSNNAATNGGAMAWGTASPTVTNCTFTGNTASIDGGGMFNSTGNPTVRNCTFFQNAAFENGGAIWGGIGTFANCIVWDNGGPGVSEIFGTPTVTYSDVLGGFAGMGNIEVNPMFIDFNDQDLHLSAGSPCIDAADNTAVPADTDDLDDDFDFAEPTPFDLDGNPRFIDDPLTSDTGAGECPVVDMGAYEYQDGSTGCCGDCPTDVDGSGNTGASDLAVLLGSWGPCAPGDACECLDSDGNGIIGAADLAQLLGTWGPCP